MLAANRVRIVHRSRKGSMSQFYDLREPDFYDRDARRADINERQRHSGFGIASLAIGILVGLMEFALFVVAGVMETTQPGGVDESSPEAIVLGLCLIGGLGVCLFGALLGAVSFFQRDRLKVFGVLGIGINLSVLTLAVGLVALGLAME
jgi:hypothetical protein